MISAVVLAVCMPVSALADEPVAGDTATVVAPNVQVTPEGDLIIKSASPAITAVTNEHVVESKLHLAAIKRIKAQKAAKEWLSLQILHARQDVYRWSTLMGVTARPVYNRHLALHGLVALKRTAKAWKDLARKMRIQAQHPPDLSAFLCIHHFEGSWTDPNGPYYGGLQMDLGFQSTYGGWLLRTKGTADHWTPLEQIWTAEKAKRTRGYWPWPNTARYCGLL